MRHLYRTKKHRVGAVPAVLAFLLVLAAFFALLRGTGGSASEHGREQLAAAVRRAAATCYAVEGRYPPSLSYLCEHYGVHIDEGNYTVRYEVFASNLMPDITVLPKGVG